MTPPQPTLNPDATLPELRRARISHAENPVQPGVALCGAKLTGRPRSAGTERCIVCLDLTRRPFSGR